MTAGSFPSDCCFPSRPLSLPAMLRTPCTRPGAFVKTLITRALTNPFLRIPHPYPTRVPFSFATPRRHLPWNLLLYRAFLFPRCATGAHWIILTNRYLPDACLSILLHWFLSRFHWPSEMSFLSACLVAPQIFLRILFRPIVFPSPAKKLMPHHAPNGDLAAHPFLTDIRANHPPIVVKEGFHRCAPR